MARAVAVRIAGGATPHREFLDEGCAYFGRADSPQAIAQGIVAALADPSGAADRSRRARALIAQWTVEAATRQYLELDRQVEHATRQLEEQRDRHRAAIAKIAELMHAANVD